jgi:hypothetical protein
VARDRADAGRLGLVLVVMLAGCEGGGTEQPQASALSSTPSSTGVIPAGTASIEPGIYRIHLGVQRLYGPQRPDHDGDLVD